MSYEQRAAYESSAGLVGSEMWIRDRGRHPCRPAHVHCMISAETCEKLVTHVFIAGDKYIDSDVVFGVKESLIKALAHQHAGPAPDGREADKDLSLIHIRPCRRPLARSSYLPP